MTHNAFSTTVKIVLGESLIASSFATVIVIVFDVPVWAMFIGWISFFTRGLTLQHGIINLACVLIGVILGICAAQALSMLTPHLDSYAISVVVFAITVITLSLAKAPIFNNLLSIFLGLVAYFALHTPQSITAFGVLVLATTLGATAAFLAHFLQKYLQRHAAARSLPSPNAMRQSLKQ